MSGESPDALFEDAPCGYLVCRQDGTIVRANRTFAEWSGHDPASLIDRRFSDLLTPAGRIYHETHYAPMLRMYGEVREIALDFVTADGRRLPALVTSRSREGELVRTVVFEAAERRSYEQELLRSRRREHEVALELQRSLLGGPLPTFERAEAAVVYRPAEQGVEVGGDWYDAFTLDERSAIALVVGDVVGRGVTAAATMGQLRSALRALVAMGLAPGPALTALDRFAAQHAVGRMTTIAHVEVDCETGAAAYACAGHPPPLLASPGEPPRFLWDGRSVPLDAFTNSPPRRVGHVQLDAGATLLLYSDGLIERRDQSLDVGFDTLAAVVAEHVDQPLQALLDAVVRRLDDGGGADDVCLLGFRRRAAL